MATIEELTDALAEANFPATKQQLVDLAMHTGATEDVINDLNSLPDEDYATIQNIWSALGLVGSETKLSPDDEEFLKDVR